MRKVNKNFKEVPEALQRGFEEKFENLKNREKEHGFDGRIYNTAIKKQLQALYHNKCAYCEGFISDKEFTVEHYRPKKGDSSYYWLGYEWTNLLPVCKTCNGPKGERFPIEGTRKTQPPVLSNGDWDKDAMAADSIYLRDEIPFLLHPEIEEDNPREFLFVNRVGQIFPIFVQEANSLGYKKALYTITLTAYRADPTKSISDIIIGGILNRDDLIYKRRSIIQRFENQLKRLTANFLKVNPHVVFPLPEQFNAALELTFFETFESIESQFNDEEEYTLTAWSIWQNIEELIFAPVCQGNTEIAALLNYALDLYKKSKP